MYYKLRTFFHRLFGGAFLGSHTKRLEKLRDKVTNKIGRGDFLPASQTMEKNHKQFLLYFQNSCKKFLEIENYKFSGSGNVISIRKSGEQVISCWYYQGTYQMEYIEQPDKGIPKILDKICSKAIQEIYKDTTKKKWFEMAATPPD